MESEILYADEFAVWLNEQSETVSREIRSRAGLLRERGPNLGRPYADTVKNSAFSNLKELRIQIAGEPWRVLFAFGPNRECILLVGGNKQGDKRWYKTHIPIAVARFRRHLDSLKT